MLQEQKKQPAYTRNKIHTKTGSFLLDSTKKIDRQDSSSEAGGHNRGEESELGNIRLVEHLGMVCNMVTNEAGDEEVAVIITLHEGEE